MSGVRVFTVHEDEDGQRIDRWLKKHLPRVPYALFQKMLRTGQIRVDGKRAKPETRLLKGQEIRLPPMEDKDPNLTFHPREDDGDFIKSITLFDDGEVLALNKPYGLPVQGGPNIKRHIDGMLWAATNRKGVRPRLVHRLDRDTSGVLLCARSLKVTQSLAKIFESRTIRKYYWALIAPPPEKDEGQVRASLIKGEGTRKEAMVIDSARGKDSLTLYKILGRHEKAAFAAFWPRTGRMHQIRVHTADGLGSPIIGDEKYGGLTKLIDDMGIPGRLHLHAWRVQLPHPTTGALLDITAPLAEDLRASWDAFGFDPDFQGNLFEKVTV